MKDGAISAVRFADGTPEGSPGTGDLAWWSVTKLALAAAALLLARAGRIDLDAAVEGAGGASLRALLAHRGRIANYSDLDDYRAAVARGAAPWPPEDMLARVAALPRPAGWAYSNTGYHLVRRAIERAADAPIGRVLGDLVLSPLGIADARIASRPEEMAALALPAPDYDPGWVYHGCLIGPAASAARLVDGVLAGPILTPGARAAMRATTPVPDPGPPWGKAAYGLGLMTRDARRRDPRRRSAKRRRASRRGADARGRGTFRRRAGQRLRGLPFHGTARNADGRGPLSRRCLRGPRARLGGGGVGLLVASGGLARRATFRVERR